jgi:hypothetical protein
MSASVRPVDARGTTRNALPEHRPLGGINRARKNVYEDSSGLRHKTTGLTAVTPTGRESF